MKLTLTVLEESYSIHRCAPDAAIPEIIQQGRFYSVTRSDEELSIVCEARFRFDAPRSEKDWRMIKIIGPLNFSLTGILAEIAAHLAAVKISIFSLSTFDTDYILVRSDTLAAARQRLEQAGHRFI